jgi:tripartite-type tricarboxylate transporter receptor subunit TctC
LKERLQAQGAIPSGMTSADFARHIGAETAKWAKVVKAAGAKVD